MNDRSVVKKYSGLKHIFEMVKLFGVLDGHA